MNKILTSKYLLNINNVLSFGTIDNVFILLLLRAALTFIPSMYMQEQYYWGNVISYVVAPVVYLIVINRRITLKSIMPFLKAFAIVSTIQCLILFISSPVPYTDVLYKYYFVSPSGASNYLACIMAIVFVTIFYGDNNKRKWLWYFIGFLGIFFTKSRTGSFAYVLVPCIYAILNVGKKGTISVKATRRACIVVLAALTLGGVFFRGQIGSALRELVDSLMRGFTMIGSDITSGRIDQFFNQLMIALKYPLFGAGFTFTYSIGSMHNFILESFYVSGIFGLIIQIALLVYIAQYVKAQKKNYGALLFLIFTVSFFEKVLFTTTGEFVLWSLVGIIYNENIVLKQQVLE